MMNDTLIDPLGNWLVKPSWGKYIISIHSPLGNQKEPGIYHLKLIHNMRDDQLCDIAGVGVNFFKE